jgi:thioredoxin reductase (NADPH)
LDIEIDEEAHHLLELSGADGSQLPLVLFPDGPPLVQPTNIQFAEKLGLRMHPGFAFYDMVIVGTGPAGLAAAVYRASEGLSTLLIESEAPVDKQGRTPASRIT